MKALIREKEGLQNEKVRQDSSAGTATGYRLDGRVSIHGKGKILPFSTAFRPDLGPTRPPIKSVPEALSPG